MDEFQSILKLGRNQFRTVSDIDKILFKSVILGIWANFERGTRISSDRIIWLITNSQASRMVTYRGIAIRGASIEGPFDLEYAEVLFPIRFADCAFSSLINLQNSRIHLLDLGSSQTRGICGEGMMIEGDLRLDNGFISRGEIEILGTTINGDFICSSAYLINPLGDSLDADAIHVKGSVYLDDGFISEGHAHMRGARIDGRLDCGGGMFLGHLGSSLSCDGVTVGADVFLNNGFCAEGEVNFYGARIEGQLSCDDGKFESKSEFQKSNDMDETAFCGMQIHAKEIYLCDGFDPKGKIDLEGALIDQCLAIRRVHVNDLYELDLRSVRTNILFDEVQSWPQNGNLQLDGFDYRNIDTRSPLDVEKRLNWLRAQPNGGFHPQPYEQLATVLRRAGKEEDAKKIQIAKNRDNLKFGQLSMWSKIWLLILDLTIGFGYKPGKAIPWAIGIIILGSIVFGVGFHLGVMTTTERGVEVSAAGAMKFNAVVYSIDRFIPVIDFHEADQWFPDGNNGALIYRSNIFELRTGGLLCLYMYLHIFLGWMLTSLLIVGLTGLLRR